MRKYIVAGTLACMLLLPHVAPAKALQSVIRLTECTCGEDSQCYLAGKPVNGGKELVVLMTYDVYERLCEKPSSKKLAPGEIYAVTYRKETFAEEGDGGTYKAFGLVKIEKR
ncbi:MAG: hypothetical protein J5863_09785 [Desulfovibrio sp.]|nr:hypothetical protein [Desulfovibrio sp.]